MGSQYPECDKVAAVRDESQAIGNFIEWLVEQDMGITEEREMEDEYGDMVVLNLPIGVTVEKLLARYFDIDLQKVEAEKQKILDSL